MTPFGKADTQEKLVGPCASLVAAGEFERHLDVLPCREWRRR